MKAKTMMSICGVIAAFCPLKAKTVAWYHFDEAPSGTRTTGESVIVNSVDPEVGVGSVRTWRENNYSAPVIETDEAYMPVYTNMEDYVCVLDPVPYRFHRLQGALHLCSTDMTSAFSDGSFFSIADHEKFHNQSFTVEFFVKLPAVSHGGTYRFLADKPFPRDGSLEFTAQKSMFRIILSRTQLYAHFRPDPDTAPVEFPNVKAVADGNWHHVALVVDGVKREISLYVDGSSATKTYSGEGAIDYEGGMPLTFGPSPERYYGTFEGEIDEIRISDKALSKEEFLSFDVRAPLSPLTGPDTLFYTSFTGSLTERTTELKYAGSTFTFIPAFLNGAPGRADYQIYGMGRGVRGSNALDASAIVSDVRHERLARDSIAPLEAENASSYGIGVTEEGGMPPALLLKDKWAVLSDSFTIEFFGNMAVGVPYSGKSGYTYLINQNTILSFWCNTDGKLSLQLSKSRVMTMADGETRTSKPYNDGEWHHYAIVYDKSASTMTLYIDHVRTGFLEGASFDTADAANALSDLVLLTFYYPYDSGYLYGPRDYKMDELRITRGALTPDRFLRKGWKSLRMSIR